MGAILTTERGRLLLQGVAKGLPADCGAVWDETERGYRVPADLAIINAVVAEAKARGFEVEVDDKAAEVVGEAVDYVEAWRVEAAARPRVTLDQGVVSAEVAARLYPFQLRGVAFIERAGGRCLVADQPGLGKTCQALAWASARQLGRVLVVAPASVAPNWLREVRTWWPSANAVLCRTTADAVAACKTTGPILAIMSYDVCVLAREKVYKAGWDLLVADECHRANHYETARGRTIQTLGRKVPHFIALSGTPVINQPSDVHGILQALRRDLVPRTWDFGLMFCGPRQDKRWRRATEDECKAGDRRAKPMYSWVFDGLSNVERLTGLMSLLVLRRTKKQVLSDLPEKVRVPVDVAVDQEAYERAESEARAALRGDGSALGVLTKLRQAVGALKVDAALEWIEDFLAGGDPLIVFYHHHEVGERLAAGIKVLQKTLAIIDGGTTMDARRDAVQRFQAGQVAVLLVSIRAGGEGITLTRAHDVLLLERDWTAAAEEQAEDRAHRIGQTRDVTVWVMRAPGTLDEMIEAAVERKRGFAGAVLDNGSVMNEVADMLRLKEGA